jgi:hypothetical protein
MQQVNMRVDYVVIAYRSAADLPDCLDTIAVDAPPDAKVILVDNASPDESAAVAGVARPATTIPMMASLVMISLPSVPLDITAE